MVIMEHLCPPIEWKKSKKIGHIPPLRNITIYYDT
nr:MAG TPA: hypothetical protein [Caudoviricetes sp.]